MSYLTKVNDCENKNVAIDFDGVLHSDNLGYHDGTIYGKPIDGAIQAIKEIHEQGFRIVIYSCKCHPERPLVDSKDGTKLIWEWLAKHNIDKLIEDVVWGKPHAIVYIDDKGYRFDNWLNTLQFLKTVKGK